MLKYTERVKREYYMVDYNYHVYCDHEKLKKILEKLALYKYTVKGNITLHNRTKRFWVLSDFFVKKNVEWDFYSKKEHENDVIDVDTINYSVNGNDIAAEFMYERLPVLYDYIDIIVNKKNIADYETLFGVKVRGRIDTSYAVENRDQVLIKKLLEYIDSYELETSKNKKELCKLYEEALMCFEFILNNVKDYKYKEKTIYGKTFQKKLFNGGLS